MSAEDLAPGPYAIHKYAQEGDIRKVTTCLDRGDDPNVQLPDPWFIHGPRMDTALHICCRKNHQEIARLLILRGADPALKNIMNRTPFDIASAKLAEFLRAVVDDSGKPEGAGEAQAEVVPPVVAVPTVAAVVEDEQAATGVGTPAPKSVSPTQPQSEVIADRPTTPPPQPQGTAVTADEGVVVPPAQASQSQSQSAGGDIPPPTESRPDSGAHSKQTTSSASKAAVVGAVATTATATTTMTEEGTTTTGATKSSWASLSFSSEGSSPSGDPRFGRPLGKAVPQGALLPVALHHTLEFLFAVPAPQDVFSLSCEDPRVVQLKAAFETLDPAQAGPSPVASAKDPRVVAAVMLLYFRMLPHPVIPPKYFWNCVKLTQVSSLRASLAQIRILLYKLPPVCRNIITTLCTYLHRSGLPLQNSVQTFSKLLLRPTAHYPSSSSDTAALAASDVAEVFTSRLIEYIEYVSLGSDEPNLPAASAASDQPTLADFVLEGIALYDFTGGRDNTLPFQKGQHVILVNLHRNDWLEGMIGNNRGFLPSAYVDVIPVLDPAKQIHSPSAQAAQSASSTQPGASVTSQGASVSTVTAGATSPASVINPSPSVAADNRAAAQGPSLDGSGSGIPRQTSKEIKMPEVTAATVPPRVGSRPSSADMKAGPPAGANVIAGAGSPTPAAATLGQPQGQGLKSPSPTEGQGSVLQEGVPAAAAHSPSPGEGETKKPGEGKKKSGFKHSLTHLFAGRKKKNSDDEENQKGTPGAALTTAAALGNQQATQGHTTAAAAGSSPPNNHSAVPVPVAALGASSQSPGLTRAGSGASGTQPLAVAGSPSRPAIVPQAGGVAPTAQVGHTGALPGMMAMPGGMTAMQGMTGMPGMTVAMMPGQQITPQQLQQLQWQMQMAYNQQAMMAHRRRLAAAAAAGNCGGNGLPPGWTAAQDQRGRTYYINMIAKTSQWDRPTAPAPGIPASPVPATPMNIAQGGAGVAESLQIQAEQLRIASEQLALRQAQVQAQTQTLVKKTQEFEAKKRVEELKHADSPETSWQIDYNELAFESKIGEGGFGEVFRAKLRGTVVAVKTLKGTGDTLNPKEVDKFSKEVAILRSLHHPNLVLFLGACLAPKLCMISEFMSGGSLYELLYKKKKVPDSAKRQVLSMDIARAMAYLHNSKPVVIHRDLKSLNILLDEKGEHAKVCDVGLARFKNEQQALTGAVGTFSWMPPEMMKGQPYTEKADVYSYGLVLYELVSGKLPFAGLPPPQISLRVAVYDERPSLPNSCPSKWKDLICACWATNEAERPPFIEIIDILGAIDSKK